MWRRLSLIRAPGHNGRPLAPGGKRAMTAFDSYATKYSCIHMRRENGILEMRLHTDDGPLRWGLVPHGELPDAFADVGRDRDNRVVILTGLVTSSPASAPAPARDR